MSINVKISGEPQASHDYPKLQIGKTSKSVYLMSSAKSGFRLTGTRLKYITDLFAGELVDFNGEVVITNGS